MIPLLFALMLAQDKAVVEGVVLNAVTGEPVRKAGVTLGAGKKSYAAVSSGEGMFHFEGVEPGEYYPRAERQGFLDAYDEPFLTLAAGQELKNLILKLTPQGIIAGHVVDEDGDPVANAGVGVERSIMVNGRKVLFESYGENTNSEGYFFTDELKPGSYRLSAEPPMNSRPQDGSPREDYVFTEGSSPIQLAPGAALRDVEIRLRKSTVHRVRGRVLNAPEKRASLFLFSDSGGSFRSRIKDGDFSFESVPPGRYTIKENPGLARRADGTFAAPSLFCHVPVTISDHDVDGVVVEFAPGPDINGTIRIEGEGRFAKPPIVGIAGDFRQQFPAAAEDGTFVWTNLAPQPHNVSYTPPDGFYVKSVQFNHEGVKNWRIDLSSGSGGEIEIVVAPNAATVSATVPGANRTTVALWNVSTFRTQETGSAGAVNFKGLAPGQYRIAAWQKVDSAYLSIPEFRDRFDAQKITVAEGSHASVEVKLISKSASDAEIAKLQ